MADDTIVLRRIQFDVCELCLGAAGGECHVPGCTFWFQDAPVGSVLAWLRERAELSDAPCTDDCTTDCGRCKGKPYFVRRSRDGRHEQVMWRLSDHPSASFNRLDFAAARSRAEALAAELNGMADSPSVPNGDVS